MVSCSDWQWCLVILSVGGNVQCRTLPNTLLTGRLNHDTWNVLKQLPTHIAARRITMRITETNAQFLNDCHTNRHLPIAAERPPSADGGGRISMSRCELPLFRCMAWFAVFVIAYGCSRQRLMRRKIFHIDHIKKVFLPKQRTFVNLAAKGKIQCWLVHQATHDGYF